ncbi:MAG: histidinol dehydrogenase [Pseudoclavibacter sp.]|nr:histidinol dehydrogenase [Pseudoclavibacter sp.]
MLRTVDLRSVEPSGPELRAVLPRPELDVAAAERTARELVAEVRERGEAALLEQAERLDGVRPARIRVPAEAIERAVRELDPALRSALERMIERVRLGSAAQVPPETVTRIDDGGTVTQRWQPVDRVGLYVPGGKAVYPSSVVMNVVPARTAQVRSLAIASPPQREHDGLPHPTILAAAGLLEVDEVYAMGGAGAIGAFAHGVPGIGLDPVEVITGPGNVWVAAAKRAVSALVGIDAEAGPTEILIIADGTADPELIAADLVSQAEHDEMAAAVLVCTDAELAERVERAVRRRAAATPHAERASAALGGAQSAILLAADLAQAARLANAYGAEHLEIHTADDEAVLARITNAGAIFLGPCSPVSLGDYLAGSNHVLPTGGQAARSSGLGAHTFLRAQQIVRYERDALAAAADDLLVLARAEELPAHGEAVTARTG